MDEGTCRCEYAPDGDLQAAGARTIEEATFSQIAAIVEQDLDWEKDEPRLRLTAPGGQTLHAYRTTRAPGKPLRIAYIDPQAGSALTVTHPNDPAEALRLCVRLFVDGPLEDLPSLLDWDTSLGVPTRAQRRALVRPAIAWAAAIAIVTCLGAVMLVMLLRAGLLEVIR